MLYSIRHCKVFQFTSTVVHCMMVYCIFIYQTFLSYFPIFYFNLIIFLIKLYTFLSQLELLSRRLKPLFIDSNINKFQQLTETHFEVKKCEQKKIKPIYFLIYYPGYYSIWSSPVLFAFVCIFWQIFIA